jgi:hypothetical protein
MTGTVVNRMKVCCLFFCIDLSKCEVALLAVENKVMNMCDVWAASCTSTNTRTTASPCEHRDSVSQSRQSTLPVRPLGCNNV